MSAKEVELQRLNNGKGLLEQRLDEILKQKEHEQAVSPESKHLRVSIIAFCFDLSICLVFFKEIRRGKGSLCKDL